MTEYERLVRQAYKLVAETNKSYLEGNNMAYVGLILGIGPCMLEDYEGNGHSFRAIDDAVHLYVADNPESKANIGFIDGIERTLDKFPITDTFEFVINYIKYELEKEKKGENTFDFNGMDVLMDLRLLIAANIATFKTDPEFLFWIEKEDQYFNKNYGFSISDGIDL